MAQIRKDVLNGWKEIAAYLGRDPRTVERWEKQRSLPVRRLPGSGRATVYALVPELDAWLASAPTREAELSVAAPLPAPVEPPAPDLPSIPPSVAVLPSVPEAGREDSAPAARAELPARWRRHVLQGASALVLVGCGLAATYAFHAHTGAHAGERLRLRTHTLVPASGVAGVEALYMRGTYQAEQRTPDSLRRAQEAFRAALARDPSYAPAYAGLGSTFLLLREYATMPDVEAYPQARAAAMAALSRDPDLPQAHAVLGFVRFFWEWRPDEADREFQSALRTDPELALSHHWYGSVLTHQGRFADGLRELEAAQRLDPSSAAILTTRMLALGLGGQRDEATELLEEAVSSDKVGHARNPATMHAVLGMLSLLPPRDVPRYLSETLLAAQLRQDVRGVEMLHRAAGVYQERGEAVMWRSLLEEERRRAVGRPTYAAARLEAETGDRAAALEDLRKLYERHDPALIGLAIDPLLAPLRPEPQFQQLCMSMGLPVPVPK